MKSRCSFKVRSNILTNLQTLACSSEKSSSRFDKVVVSVLMDERSSLLSSIWLLKSFNANATAKMAIPSPPTVIRSYRFTKNLLSIVLQIEFFMIYRIYTYINLLLNITPISTLGSSTLPYPSDLGLK